MRLIFILRDPVARAFSQYRHNIRVGRKVASFESEIEQERIREGRATGDDGYIDLQRQYLRRGRYIEHIAMTERYFAPTQILPLCSEIFHAVSRTGEILAEIYEFIGVSTHANITTSIVEKSRAPKPASSTATAIEMSAEMERKLEAYFRPFNSRMDAWLERNNRRACGWRSGPTASYRETEGHGGTSIA